MNAARSWRYTLYCASMFTSAVALAAPPAGALQRALGSGVGDPQFDSRVDLNGDGIINACDVALWRGAASADGGIAGGSLPTLSFESANLYPSDRDVPRLKLFAADCATPLFGYSAALRVVPLVGATGSVSAWVEQSTFFPPRHMILAAPSQPPLDPMFSGIFPMAQGGIFINANTQDGSLVQPVDGVNDALGDVAFSVAPGTQGVFLVEFGAATALSGPAGQPVPFDSTRAQISVGPRLQVSAVSEVASVAPGSTLVVLIRASEPLTSIDGADLAIRFDPERLALQGARPAEGGPFAIEVLKEIDQAEGALRYHLTKPNSAPSMTTASTLAELRFTVLKSDSDCAATGLVEFNPVGWAATVFTSAASTEIEPVVASLGSVSIDGTAPALAGISESVALAVDAGTTVGGTVAEPMVTALDACDGEVPVAISIVYPSGATGVAWPNGGVFPIGTSVVTYSAADAAGNVSAVSRLVTVLDHQLLDVNLSYQGANIGNAPRALRVKAGASTQVVPFAMVAGAATIEGIQVPVSAGYACISVKDTGFSLTSAAAPSVSARRYAANFTVVQGDSDDDDFIDITDFGFLFVDRGLQSPQSRSNFNADSVVNNADLGFISVNFFRGGDTCTPGADAPRAPRRRIHVKELRRMGLGELAAADLNGDGWVDLHDVQLCMQGGGGSVATPTAPTGGVSNGW